VSLAALANGQTGRFARADVDGDLQARLCALGLVPGKVVQVMRRAAFGGTLHLKVGSTEFMLRPGEASGIWVQPLTAATGASS
jgi:ferrous iron transport protein A